MIDFRGFTVQHSRILARVPSRKGVFEKSREKGVVCVSLAGRSV